MAQLNANLSKYEVQEDIKPLPPGEYTAKIVDSELKQGPSGSYIRWTFQVIGYPNRIWDTMSLGNEISLKRLKTLATVSGHPNPNFIADTEEMHGLECVIKIRVEEDPTGKYDPKNVITAFKKKADNGHPAIPVPPAVAAAAARPQAPATPRPKMPWE